MSELLSITSSKTKDISTRRSSKKYGRNYHQNSIIKARKNIVIYDDGYDVTPKTLTHDDYRRIDSRQMFVFDLINLAKIKDDYSSQTTIFQRKYNDLFQSDLTLNKLIDNNQAKKNNALLDEPIESLFTTQDNNLTTKNSHDDLSRAPSPFCLPKLVEDLDSQKSTDTLKIRLRETETIIYFEMLQLTADLNTQEGQDVKLQNERYEYITSGEGSNRKLANAETQTPKIYTKTRSTFIGRNERCNFGTTVNNWVMYDTYADPNIWQKKPEPFKVIIYRKITAKINQLILQLPMNFQDRNKFLIKKIMNEKNDKNIDESSEIFNSEKFKNSVQIMERIIASNLYIKSQKRFKGLIKQDPCDLNLKFIYNLDLLWTHYYEKIKNYSVCNFCWNEDNKNILAVGYYLNDKKLKNLSNGYVLIWCMKNPNQPDRIYEFKQPISDLNWSLYHPNQLAIGFYDGSINIIDVCHRNLTILRKSIRLNSPIYSPQWQVQWWPEDDNLNINEKIYTTNQDGGIFCYRTGEDFTCIKIMKICKIEGTICGVKKTKICHSNDIKIKKNPSAVLLKKHPVKKNIYIVCSDEGCVYQCSTNYLNHHIDSYLAHDGEIYSFEYSPYFNKLYLTCGADWCTRIWIEGLHEPLITLKTHMSCVRSAVWSPKNSTIIATCINNEICIWDIKKKIYKPMSVTIVDSNKLITKIQFTHNGEQIVAADINGAIFIYNIEGIPFSPFNQKSLLIESVEKHLITKPNVLKKFKT
ncbi:dynein axonemal intermediate chain 4-like, partial [Aphidius gifuensis]